MINEVIIFNRTIPIYSLCAVLGLVLGIFFVIFRSKKYNVSVDDSVYIFVFGVVGALLGAKILYLLLSISAIASDVSVGYTLTQLGDKYFRGGMVFYGGLIGAFLLAYIASKAYNADFWKECSVIIPAIPLVHGMSRMGCFFAGCCHGIEANTCVSVQYSISNYAPNGVYLVPVQLIEIGLNIIIFVILLSFKQGTSGKTYVKVYALLYAIMRFFLEFLRGDAARGFLLGLSTSQWISLFIIAIILAWISVEKRRVKGAKV